MFKSYKIKLVKDHIILDDEQNLLIDTGSPSSFNKLGLINLCGEDIIVNTSTQRVSPEYLSSKIGFDIDGLVGMDIIHRYPIMIDIPCGCCFVDDDGTSLWRVKSYEMGAIAQGLIAIEMLINGHSSRMIVDTGAPVSYINKNIIKGVANDGEIDDFHPLIGNYKTQTHRCNVTVISDFPGNKSYNQLFGVLPNMIASSLSLLQVDGIIGIDFFKRYRVVIRNKRIYLPPQGI